MDVIDSFKLEIKTQLGLFCDIEEKHHPVYYPKAKLNSV